MIIIANIIAFTAASLMVYSGILKSKKKIIFIQVVETIMCVVSNFLLGGFTGAIINALNFVRNLLCYRGKLNLKNKLLIMFLSVTISLIFNNLGIIGILPIISAVICSAFMDTKSVVKLKITLAVSMLLWLIYDTYLKCYAATFFDTLFIIINIISAVRILINEEKEKIILLLPS